MFLLVDSSESGISFINKLEPTPDLNILTYLYYYNGAGVAIADFNNDGLQDIYFTSNQGPDKLFLNKGNLKFDDITEISGINNTSEWTTGVTHVDINNDGLLDIYVCKVSGYKSLKGANQLYINQGIKDGIPVFKEQAELYGLNISALSTQAAFFDYDLDGDLDMYLLTHSVHPNLSYGKGENRHKADPLAGDKFFENINGRFIDASTSAGIYQGKIGYGLGISVGDLNDDGYPDVYIGNDFFENDYYYLNTGSKSFQEKISADPEIFGHTSHYSMGNCMADINNDGRLDLVSLDMLPEDLQTLKSSGVEEGYSIYNQYLKNGYSPQFMQNTLHINRGENIFSEQAYQAGIAATEWSWGALVADFDQDGLKDLYITNGILGATNDMDYINYISQDRIQYQLVANDAADLVNFTKSIPEKKIKNYAFKNKGNVSFENVMDSWFDAKPSFSNGSAYADLDNDGDLDLVINNVNEQAFIYENRANKSGKNYIKVKLQGPEKNYFGIGAKIYIYSGNIQMFEQHFPVKSFLSTVSNDLIFGLGDLKKIDSVTVEWPDFKRETLKGIDVNQTILFSYSNAKEYNKSSVSIQPGVLKNSTLTVDFKHHEESSLDFDREPLIPFALSNEGPDIAVADVNNDSLDDFFIGGGKMQPGELFIQNKSGEFLSVQKELFIKNAISEDVDQLFFDADNDGDMDLLVVSGGNEFKSGGSLQPRLYINDSGNFTLSNSAFQKVAINASVVKSVDIENDGDDDVIICSNALPGQFGKPARNYIFLNNNGEFIEASEQFSREFSQAGLINDVAIADFDNNGYQDILVAGDWMPVMIFLNDGASLSSVELPDTEGWWNVVEVEDFDNDGDLDIVAGNWGHNTRLSASITQPIEMFRNDFDGNGAVEPIITYYYKGEKTILASKDEVAKQMPFINKKFTSYIDFAKAKVEDIFSEDKLTNAEKKEVKVLSSCYFENKGNDNFKQHVLPANAQISSVNDIYVDDFNDDGFRDLLLIGNNYEISTQLGRLDASHGELLLNDKAGFFNEHKDQVFNIAGPARKISKVAVKGTAYYIITINNGKPVFLEKEIK